MKRLNRKISKKIKSEPAGEYLCVVDDELTFQKYNIDNQYWEINNNRIYFGGDRRICLSINSNNDQHQFTLAEAQVSLNQVLMEFVHLSID